MNEPAPDLNALAADLFQRHAEGQIVRRAIVRGMETFPNQCHDNVRAWVNANPHHKQVFGFLYFDFGRMLHYVIFRPHSVVEIENGELVDITPLAPGTSGDSYPFIRHIGSFELFAAAAERMGLTYKP